MPSALHVHSWHSLLEGVSSPASLVRRAVEGGYSSLALTDTNNLYGIIPFVEEATRAGLRPLVGASLRAGGQRAVALVADAQGYRSLCQVISKIHLAPQALLRNEEGGGGSTAHPPPACPSAHPVPLHAPFSAVGQSLLAHGEGLHVLTDDIPLACTLRDAFQGRLWLQIVRPGSREGELLDAGRRLGLKPVASTAAHLLDPGDEPVHRLITAVRRVTLLDRLPARLPITPEHRLVSAAELRRRFRDLPQAIAHGDELASLLRSDVLPPGIVLPPPRLSHGLDPIAYLRALCERGLRERGLGGDLKARHRLRKEQAIIEANGLPGYFLVVRDLTRFARKKGRTMALRGSAGNSLVCYLLGITEVDPLRFGLELERFLHPGRTDLPDIDLDFDWKVRDEIIDYAFRRFGPAHVARISSHLSFQPRSAFREASKVHGLSTEQVSELLLSLDARLDALLLPEGEFVAPRCPRSFPLESARWSRLLGDARRLLGRPSHLSLHPGGIVITPGPIAAHAPLERAARGVIMMQYDKDAVEAVGLVKIDLLGNRALSTVDEARSLAGAAIPAAVESATDPATLGLLRRGDTLGITQLESPAMRHLLLQMKPRGLDDVIQALALLRPGAASIGMKECFIRRRAGLEAPPLAHPLLAALLGETHGLMVYEDDSLRLLQILAGFGPADADRFRKRVSKHATADEEATLRAEFMARCARQGFPSEELGGLWAQMARFNRYSFCKSHSVSYGLIAWQAAFLKAHHPLAFWTAALNNAQGSYPQRVYVEAIKRAGLRLLPPCLNRSRREFCLDGKGIRVGFDSISGLPEALRESVLAERDRNGPFESLSDLRRRVVIGPEALSSLVRVGAADFTGKNRPALFLEAERKPAAEGLFSYDPAEGWSPPDDPPERRWRDEWRLLGFVLGRNLYELFRPKIDKRGAPLVSSQELVRYAGRRVRVQGLVATARLTRTEEGRPVQFITLEDEQGLVEVTIFDGTCATIPYLTMGPYVATGTVEDRHGALAVTARQVERASACQKSLCSQDFREEVCVH